MMPVSASTAGTKVNVGTWASSLTCHWTLEKAKGIFLQDTSTHELIDSSTVKSVELKNTLTLSELGIKREYYGSLTNLSWTSSKPVVASVNSSGTVVCKMGGETTITITATIEGSSYTQKYILRALIPDGTYYIRNKELDLYMQIDDNAYTDFSVSNTIMEVWPYKGANQQKWIITHLDGLYYKIISAESGLALTVRSEYANTGEMAIVQQAYTGANGQKWEITASTSGAYILRPKSADSYSTDWCMSVGSESGSDDGNNNVEQKAYSSDSNYNDEWLLAFPEDFLSAHIPSTTFAIQCVGDTMLSDTWYNLLSAAVDSWNNSSANTNITLTESTSNVTCTVISRTESWLGLCTSVTVGSTIISSSIEINAQELPESSNTRQSTIAHEIGHVLGLDDNPIVNNSDNSLMSHTRNREITFTPQAHDVQNVIFIYCLE